MRPVWICLSLVLPLACSSGGTSAVPADASLDQGHAADVAADRSSGADLAPDSVTDAAVPGDALPHGDDAGTMVTGGVSGGTFGTAYAAIRGGMPDDPTTMVIFIADAPFTCAAVTPGWDTRLPVGAHVVELKVFGMTPGTYRIATTDPTVTLPGNALANYATISRPVPSETSAEGGQVVITEVGTDRGVAGSFSLDYRLSDHVAGSFRAVYCPTGTEP